VSDSRPIIVPFLKWAGGKRWLTSRYAHLLPSSYNRYIEPFLGSAAVFFHLQPTSAVLSDANADLINAYQQIQSHWHKVRRALARHQRNHSTQYYYEERDRKHRAPHERAAQLIYLNRTCWNGLYRVNLRGEFNVPIGTKTAVLLDTDDFEYASLLLRRATLLASDFEPIIGGAKENDFVFVDPPYVTRHNFNGFLKYNDRIFSWNDQERLAQAVRAAADRGVKVLLTNADHCSVRRLYLGFGSRVTLRRHSVLAADSGNRGATTEIAVTINCEPEKVDA
jgi:DNA adenine methylase